ncbi:phosphate acyltransferase [Rhodobacter xanthinilyticus]|uniref:Phosphate acyltransferase n=1 Tax=Rhodobacter xanthinilyticus TaxID=1850250 RepID=A0A1D9MD78_9RHOB|nr:phosphate acyltransferase PlsX [Rhodobacter xanthinilyticus]AOZ69738.1 phosphate acyltransferase [Rhodobacter xanthinilyticus]
MADAVHALGTTAPGTSGALVISVDAMGGDRGPEAVLDGVAIVAKSSPALRFIVHGPEATLAPLLAARGLSGVCTLRHAEGVVTMHDKPSAVMRNGKGTSMWSTIESVRAGEAEVAVSCGNTGALMAVSMLRLRKMPGVNRPAIASFWPSRNPSGWNVMLDMGADVKADAPDLLTYGLMGTSYARNALGLTRPRVGLLNVGTEEHKGHAELKAAYELMRAAQDAGQFEFIGFVEGNDLPSARVDVIVTDGFTGNIALKTGEGTAKLAGDLLKDALTASWLSKLGALLAMGPLKRMKARIDPRRANGGVFLGLNGTVVKSHGGADATGFAAALELAARLARSGFRAKLAARVASASVSGQDAPDIEAVSE